MKYEGSQYSALASYKNNALFTTFPHKADLKLLGDPTGSLDTEVAQEVLGLQVHEYIHQLHNFSTAAGIQMLKNRLVALQVFATGTNADGHYVRQGQTFNGIDKSKLINFERDYYRIIGNTDKIEEEGFLSEFSFETIESSEETDDPSDPCNILGVKIKFKLGGIARVKVIDNVGYNIITEGIAYEIERKVRNTITGKNGMLLDYSTPPLPYRFYRPIVEHLVGRPCSLSELVKVGTLALQNEIPSWGLKAATLALKHGEEVFDAFASDVANGHQETFSRYKEVINLLLSTTFKGTAVKEGLTMLDDLVTNTIVKREKDPFFELVFLREPLTRNVFEDIIQSEGLPPRCILQKKSDEDADEKAELYWMGNGVADLPEATIGAVSTLQCAVQFSQLHLSKDASFNNTSGLNESPHDLSCPYLEVCPLRESREDSDLCSSSPWMHDIGVEAGEVCWYVNGVKSLRNLKYTDYDERYI